MRITQDIRKLAYEQSLSEQSLSEQSSSENENDNENDVQEGMEQKSKQFREGGSRIYV